MDDARKEIFALMRHAEIKTEPPDWLKQSSAERNDGRHYLVVGGDIVFPAKKMQNSGRYLLLSCITRGSLSAKARQRKIQLKHKRRDRNKGRRPNKKETYRIYEYDI